MSRGTSAEDNLRYDVVFSGNVQGVYFRATAHDLASGYPVCGWVRNEPDKTVRCVVEGPREALDAFVAAVRRAKRENIADVRIAEQKATGEFDHFEIRY
jgi:acylphosphatase